MYPPTKLYQVNRYFDGYIEGVVGVYPTEKEAQDKIDSMPKKIYTDYMIREV